MKWNVWKKRIHVAKPKYEINALLLSLLLVLQCLDFNSIKRAAGIQKPVHFEELLTIIGGLKVPSLYLQTFRMFSITRKSLLFVISRKSIIFHNLILIVSPWHFHFYANLGFGFAQIHRKECWRAYEKQGGRPTSPWHVQSDQMHLLNGPPCLQPQCLFLCLYECILWVLHLALDNRHLSSTHIDRDMDTICTWKHSKT